jgi:hypothetical protein
MSPDRLSNITVVVVEDHDVARRYLGLFSNQIGATVVSFVSEDKQPRAKVSKTTATKERNCSDPGITCRSLALFYVLQELDLCIAG